MQNIRNWSQKSLTIALATAVALMGLLFFVPKVEAHEDPSGCAAIGNAVGISVNTFRSDGTTPVGVGTLTDGEAIVYKSTLEPLGSNCSFEGGTWTITTPDGTITDVTPVGGIPQIGGSGVGSLTSVGVPYTVLHANEVDSGALRKVSVNANYTGGTSHDGGDSPDAAGSIGKTNTVVHPDLHIVKSDSPDPVSSGGVLTYTITVTNAGAATATAVTVTDTWPAGFTPTLVTPSQGSCSDDDPLNCNLGDLEPSGVASVTIAGTVSGCSDLNNTANVSTSSNEMHGIGSGTGDNSDSEPTDVTCPDVHVLKTAANTPITAGDTASFTITTSNAGPGTATNVVTTDTLPGGLTWVENPDNPNCVIVAGVLTCTYASMPESGSDPVTVEAVTAVQNCGTLENLASVTADNEDPQQTGDNSSEVSIVVEGCTGEIHGLKWEDLNKDGVIDQGEALLTGWTIFIEANDNGQLDLGEMTTTTMADDLLTLQNETGMYWFVGIPAGSYEICEVMQVGWFQTYPADADKCHTVVVGGGQVIENVNFGNHIFEGCTPGYWKQSQHSDSWVGYVPGDSFQEVFSRDVPGNPTLLQALQMGGGGLKALMRHATAALLNSANPGVEYAYDTATVIAMFQAAFDSSDYDTTKDLFALNNELGCPLN